MNDWLGEENGLIKQEDDGWMIGWIDGWMDECLAGRKIRIN